MSIPMYTINNESVIVGTERYQHLCDIEKRYDALVAAGVDNWPGYHEAMKIYNEEEPE